MVWNILYIERGLPFGSTLFLGLWEIFPTVTGRSVLFPVFGSIPGRGPE
jgi:hypothetical protein